MGAILCCHATTAVEDIHKDLKTHFGFVYCNDIGIKPKKEDQPSKR